jgi:hypothetical protein
MGDSTGRGFPCTSNIKREDSNMFKDSSDSMGDSTGREIPGTSNIKREDSNMFKVR